MAKIKIPFLAQKTQEKIIEEVRELEEKSKTAVINNLQEEKEKILKKYL